MEAVAGAAEAATTADAAPVGAAEAATTADAARIRRPWPRAPWSGLPPSCDDLRIGPSGPPTNASAGAAAPAMMRETNARIARTIGPSGPRTGNGHLPNPAS
ncbi:MAG: hypothetical protein OJF55_001902 [Rhodanobacteraceae bacterium]|nr:MAG: hypothetical protein OJF55_001902 [Rhodanobacteraceae bacterium]